MSISSTFNCSRANESPSSYAVARLEGADTTANSHSKASYRRQPTDLTSTSSGWQKSSAARFLSLLLFEPLQPWPSFVTETEDDRCVLCCVRVPVCTLKKTNQKTAAVCCKLPGCLDCHALTSIWICITNPVYPELPTGKEWAEILFAVFAHIILQNVKIKDKSLMIRTTSASGRFIQSSRASHFSLTFLLYFYVFFSLWRRHK